MYDYTEMDKLEQMLIEVGADYKRMPCWDGQQIRIYDKNGDEIDDAIIHDGSYGSASGLLESYRAHECAGCETAEEIMEVWREWLAA